MTLTCRLFLLLVAWGGDVFADSASASLNGTRRGDEACVINRTLTSGLQNCSSSQGSKYGESGLAERVSILANAARNSRTVLVPFESWRHETASVGAVPTVLRVLIQKPTDATSRLPENVWPQRAFGHKRAVASFVVAFVIHDRKFDLYDRRARLVIE